MEKYFEILRKCQLFDGVADNDLKAMLSCLGGEVKKYKKDGIIFEEGEPARNIGIVLLGTAQIVRTDYYGNRSILATIVSTQLFGESFACVGVEALPINVIASADAEVLLIDVRKIICSCSNACEFHNRMIYNLLKVVAGKNLLFNQKIEVTSKRSTREKLMTYLLLQAKGHHSNSFTIPFDRQELADYLEVDRSGLSAEIGKLRAEGILECKKSTFTLL